MSAPIVVVGADDEKRRVWCEALGAFGWRVYAARDIQAAIDLAQRQQPRVIISAVTLPSASGMHFIRSLRSVVEQDVKVFGIAEAEQLAAALSAGGFDLIVAEPVDFASLQKSIEAAHDDHAERRPTTKLPRLS